MLQITTGEFRQNLSEYFDIAKFKEPVIITQHGKPNVVVLNYEEAVTLLEKKEQEEKLAAERQFYEEAAQSLRHYQETGLHTTYEEMKEWIETFKTTTPNNRKPMPKCHK